MWTAVSKRLNPWPWKTWGYKRFSKNLQTRAFEIVTSASGRHRPIIHGRCHERNGKTQNKHSTLAPGDSPGQAIVERLNRAERLSRQQCAVEMGLPEGQRSSEWVVRLPAVVSALNGEVTRLTGRKPAEAIKEKAVAAKPSTPFLRPVGKNGKKSSPIINVRYLYQAGELEGGRQRATDVVWSLKVHNFLPPLVKPNEPIVYYLQDGPKRGFVLEELLAILPNTTLPFVGDTQ